MKLGVIADIHANFPALVAVLGALDNRKLDDLVVVGDMVGVLGSPHETVSLVKEHASHVVRGNHDTRVFPDRSWMPTRPHEVVEYEQTLDELTEAEYDWLTSLSGMVTTDQDVTLAHARPDPERPDGSDREDKGLNTSDYVSVGGSYLDGGVLLLGHTHHQHAVSLDKFDGQSGLVVNPGSVGWPYNHQTPQEARDGVPVGKASYAVVDTTTHAYDLCSVEYDSSAVYDHLHEYDLVGKDGRTRRRGYGSMGA